MQELFVMEVMERNPDALISLQEGSRSPAKTLATQESAPALMESAAACGQSSTESFASYDPDMCLWKTSQLCLTGELTEYSETWPRAGMMRNGIASPLPPLVPLIAVTGSLFWPTPTTRDWKGCGQNGRIRDGVLQVDTLDRAVWAAERKMWPTPTAITNSGGAALCKWGGSGARSKLRQMVTPEELNGKLNPVWVEWLMGFPQGWTDLKD